MTKSTLVQFTYLSRQQYALWAGGPSNTSLGRIMQERCNTTWRPVCRHAQFAWSFPLFLLCMYVRAAHPLHASPATLAYIICVVTRISGTIIQREWSAWSICCFLSLVSHMLYLLGIFCLYCVVISPSSLSTLASSHLKLSYNLPL